MRRMTYGAFIKSLNIDFDKYILKEEYFDYLGKIHSIRHTGRVMNNVLMLGYLLNRPIETRKAFMAAFIHDMARVTDYNEPEHGEAASKTKAHLIESDDEILAAVKNHAQKIDLLKENPAWFTMAILKDADLLAKNRKNVTYRFKETYVLRNIISRNSQQIQASTRGIQQ